MSTKEKILKAALQLFNKHGIARITVRDIAQEIGISHGNLCYHYPNTNNIISALYDELSKKVNDMLDELQPDENVFQTHTNAIRTIFTLAYKYRFFYLHFIEITQRLPALKKKHYELIEQRKTQVRYFFDVLRQHDLFRADLSLEQYELLIMHCFLYGDFWISDSEIMYEGAASKKIDFYVNGYLALFMPYLTEKGKKLAALIT